MCNEKETYIGKTIRDNTKGSKVRINQHISDCKTGVSNINYSVKYAIVVLRINA